MNRIKIVLGALVALLIVVVGVAWGAGGSQKVAREAEASGYGVTPAASVYRTGLTAADNADSTHANNVALAKIYCGGYVGVLCHVRFSAASATVVVQCLRYDSDDNLVSMEEKTATADATRTDGTDYMAVSSVGFDTEGASYVRLLIEAPSSGNVDLWQKVY